MVFFKARSRVMLRSKGYLTHTYEEEGRGAPGAPARAEASNKLLRRLGQKDDKLKQQGHREKGPKKSPKSLFP